MDEHHLKCFYKHSARHLESLCIPCKAFFYRASYDSISDSSCGHYSITPTLLTFGLLLCTFASVCFIPFCTASVIPPTGSLEVSKILSVTPSINLVRFGFLLSRRNVATLSCIIRTIFNFNKDSAYRNVKIHSLFELWRY
jgi:hypothetical protein